MKTTAKLLTGLATLLQTQHDTLKGFEAQLADGLATDLFTVSLPVEGVVIMDQCSFNFLYENFTRPRTRHLESLHVLGESYPDTLLVGLESSGSTSGVPVADRVFFYMRVPLDSGTTFLKRLSQGYTPRKGGILIKFEMPDAMIISGPLKFLLVKYATKGYLG